VTHATTSVAFIRNVMIGREGLMRDVLLGMFASAGATDLVSYLSTGNVSFQGDEPHRVCELVETDLERLLGRVTPVFVRSLEELVALVDADPFAEPPAGPVRDEVVTLFRERVPDHLVLPIAAPNGDFVAFGAGPAELFSVVIDRHDRQPSAPGGYLERLAGEPVTTRALGTIERVVARLT
jgi:uncharacterized protein (DUF1697 family)